MENRHSTRLPTAREKMEDNAVLLTPANDRNDEILVAEGDDSTSDVLNENPDIALESQELAETSKSVSEILGPQEILGRYLRDQRELLQMSVEEIARTTKIPKTSLLSLESGKFDSLPGDVFVRGFLRSYARCLKLDGDDVIRRYAECGLCPAPVSSEMADTLLAPSERKARSFPSESNTVSDENAAKASTKATSSGSTKKSVKKVLQDAFDLARPAPKQARAKDNGSAKDSSDHKIEVVDLANDSQANVETTEKRVRVFVPPALNFGEDLSRRGPLTLGVIILVIVATLTMSYLLRRPGTSAEGFTQAPETSEMLKIGIRTTGPIPTTMA